jgi:hypothetical protein
MDSIQTQEQYSANRYFERVLSKLCVKEADLYIIDFMTKFRIKMRKLYTVFEADSMFSMNRQGKDLGVCIKAYDLTNNARPYGHKTNRIIPDSGSIIPVKYFDDKLYNFSAETTVPAVNPVNVNGTLIYVVPPPPLSNTNVEYYCLLLINSQFVKLFNCIMFSKLRSLM